MTELNENHNVYRCVSYPVQKSVYFLLKITPQPLYKPVRVVFGMVRSVFKAICGAVRYIARFLRGKLEEDGELQDTIKSAKLDEKFRDARDQIRRSDVFRRIVTFLGVVARSIAEGARFGVAEYRKIVATESRDSTQENKLQSTVAPSRHRFVRGTEQLRGMTKRMGEASMRERFLRSHTDSIASQPERNSTSCEFAQGVVASSGRSKRRFLVAFGAVAIAIVGVCLIAGKKYLDDEGRSSLNGTEDAFDSATLEKKELKAGDVKVVDIAGIETRFHWCPPGEFMMGSPENEEGRYDDETRHTVKLTRGFWLCEVLVTVEAFQKFVDDTGYETEAEKNNDTWTWKKTWVVEQTPLHPVIFVSWNDAQAYIKWLNKNYAPKGLTFKLPSEAHWEYACRAGSKTAYWWGNSIEEGKGKINLADADFKEMSEEKSPEILKMLKMLEEKGVKIVSFRDGYSSTNPVEALASNEWGIRDMHGNVCEWCSDWYGDYSTDAATDPEGSQSGSYRVVRGGGWDSDSRYCRSAVRNGGTPNCRHVSFGFRLELVNVSESEISR